MDAAQMLTAQEIARRCERLANLARQDEHPSVSAQADVGRELFGMSEADHHQVLDALVDRPEVRRADPMPTKRLRKVRASRERARAARRLGIELH